MQSGDSFLRISSDDEEQSSDTSAESDNVSEDAMPNDPSHLDDVDPQSDELGDNELQDEV